MGGSFNNLNFLGPRDGFDMPRGYSLEESNIKLLHDELNLELTKGAKTHENLKDAATE